MTSHNSSLDRSAEKVLDDQRDFFAIQANRQEYLDFYKNWSITYDRDIAISNVAVNNFADVSKLLKKHLLQHHDDVSQLLVLDVACGTGLVAEKLIDEGFKRIHGVDGSPDMVEKAKSKGFYEKLTVEFIEDKPMETVEAGFYDAAINNGSFLPNQLGPQCLRTIGLTLRSGGLFAIGMREIFTKTDKILRNFEPELEKLVTEGFWTVVHREVAIDYYSKGENYLWLVLRRN